MLQLQIEVKKVYANNGMLSKTQEISRDFIVTCTATQQMATPYDEIWLPLVPISVYNNKMREERNIRERQIKIYTNLHYIAH